MNSETFQRILRLVVKEIKDVLSDPHARTILIVPPIIQLIVFSFAISLDVKNVRLGVLNQDVGVESATFLESFCTQPIFRKVVPLRNYRELDEAIDQRKVFAALVLPPDFSQKMQSKDETAKIQLILDGRRANAATIFSGYVAMITSWYGVRATIQDVGPKVTSYGASVRRWFNPNLLARVAFMPGLICLMATTVGILVSASSISREREMGTFEQLLVSPLSPLEIVTGKTVAAVALATLSSMLIFTVVVFGFKIPLQGSFLVFLLTTILYLTSIVGVGLFISALSTTQQQSTLGCFIFMPLAVMTSGFATPVDNMPTFLQQLTIVNPARWEINVLRGLFLRGATFDAILPNAYPLALVAVFSLLLAIFMFKRRME